MSEIQAEQAISQETTAPEVSNTQAPENVVSGNSILSGNVQQNTEQTLQENLQELRLLDSLSDELKQFKALENFKDVNDLAKSYLHAQQLIGKRVQDLAPEDVAVLNQLRGVPKSSEQYQLPEQVVPDNAVKWYKDLAYKAGLTNEQAKEVFESYVGLERQAIEAAEAQRAEEMRAAETSLRKEFGQGYDQQLKLALSTVKSFGGEEVFNLLDKSGLGNNPSVIKMLAKIGENLLEDSIMEADKDSVLGATPERAKAQLEAKLKDPSFRDAYYSRYHPKHNEAVEEVKKIMSRMA